MDNLADIFDMPLVAPIGILIGCVVAIMWMWSYARRHGLHRAEFWRVLSSYGALTVIAWLTTLTVVVFPLQPWHVVLVVVVVTLSSIFAELRDGWQTTSQPSSPERVLFRTAQWATLAVAGYIVVQVLGVAN